MEKCLYTIQTGDGKGESFKAPPPPPKKNHLKLNYFKTVESMMAKLSDFLLKVI